jgi:uncharacterized membrane protein
LDAFRKDLVVILSGIVEILLGFITPFLETKRATIGLVLAIFFCSRFSGNINNDKKDAFELNSDNARLARLFFQPVLIIWSLWSTGAWKSYKISKKKIEIL